MTAPDDKRLMSLQRRMIRWSLLYHTVAPLKPAQWYARVRWVIFRQLYRRLNSFTRSYYYKQVEKLMTDTPMCNLLHADFQQAIQNSGMMVSIISDSEAICRREFTFLNETAIAEPGCCWSDPALSQLWRYHLHYFDYVVILGAANRLSDDDRYYKMFRELVTDWIEHNPVGIGDGWHPYTISLRTVNWIIAYCLFQPRIEDDSPFKNAILTSLAMQFAFVRRHLEFDVGGNHLLENIRALLWGGEFFGNKQWSMLARKQLAEQLDEQILPDGGHYERSPMYHSIVLWDILEMLAIARNTGNPLPTPIDGRAWQMIEWLAKVLHPDGDIPLFNDAVFNEAPSPAAIGSFASAYFAKNSIALPDNDITLKQCLITGINNNIKMISSITIDTSPSGYYTLGEKGSDYGWLLLDAGDPCPANLPAHAHCDLLSFEFSVGTQRMIVDSGVYQYAAGPWRDYCRSTRAHNTISIDGLEQSEVWDSFRVGRRAKPLNVRQFAGNDYTAITASHNGFAREIPGGLHARSIVLLKDKVWLVLDRVTFDEPGLHTIENFLHFHPDVKVAWTGGCWNATSNVANMAQMSFNWDVIMTSATTDPLQGWYCSEFGIKQPNPVLVMRAKVKFPFTGCYVMAPGAAEISIAGNIDDLLNIRVDGEEILFNPKCI